MDAQEDSRFTDFLLEKAEEAKNRLSYNPSYFIGMLRTEGGYRTANKLLSAKTPSDGFTKLWEHKRLDLSVEALVVESKWRPFFDKELVKRAEGTLRSVDYVFKPYSNGEESEQQAAPWTTEELRAAVSAYLEMQWKNRTGEQFSKTAYYAKLAQTFGRTEKAFEYRMQNISYVLAVMGRKWLEGLKPAKNVGAKVAAEIEAILADIEQQNFGPKVAFEIEVEKDLEKGQLPIPGGEKKPARSISQITQIARDPKVKAWVLKAAGNDCECCKKEAPFFASSGAAYLEVHHLRRLADGGSDTIYNAIAACPNCHRELHYGSKNAELLDRLYQTIERLIRE